MGGGILGAMVVREMWRGGALERSASTKIMRRAFGGVKDERIGLSGAITESGGRDLRARSTLTRAAPGAAITNPHGGGVYISSFGFCRVWIYLHCLIMHYLSRLINRVLMSFR